MSVASAAVAGGGTQRLVERYILLLMWVGFYYNIYRYPFKINSSTTSPTYSDTPMVLRVGKYAVIALVLLWMMGARSLVRQPLRIASPPMMVVLAFMAIMPVAAAGFSGNIPMLEVGFIILPAMLLLLFPEVRLPVSFVNRHLRNVIYVAFIVEAIQVALFLAFGRLPALAYENSFSVRFGSFLDDPNTMGLLVAWFFPFSALYFSGARRVAVLFGLMVLLVLTQSLTALIVFVGVFCCFVAVRAVLSKRALFQTLVGGALVMVAARVFYLAYETQIRAGIRLYFLAKAGSMDQHAEAIPTLLSIDLLNLLGFEPQPVGFFSETGYVNILGQLGAPYLLVFLGFGACAAWSALTLLRAPGSGHETRAFAAGVLGLMGALYVGNLALPMSEAYPMNLFANLMMTMMIVLRRPPLEDTSAPRPAPGVAMVGASH